MTSLLSLPTELLLEIFSFHALPRTYLSLLLTCREFFRALHDDLARRPYALRLMYSTLDGASHRLGPLSQELEPIELIRVLNAIPAASSRSAMEERMLLRLSELNPDLFQMTLVYDLTPSHGVLREESDTEGFGRRVFVVAGLTRIRKKTERRSTRSFRRDRLFELKWAPWGSPPGDLGYALVRLHGNDVVRATPRIRQCVKMLRYSVLCIPLPDVAAPDAGSPHSRRVVVCRVGAQDEIRIALPRGEFGKAILRVEELVNIFLCQQKLRLWVYVSEVGFGGEVLREIVDLQVTKKGRRRKTRRRRRD